MGKFSTIICLCDSMNYLANEEEIKQTIARVYHHLAEDGIFIFDVHSIHKIDFIFKGSTFAHNGEEISYIWECFEGEEAHSVEHDLSFFVKIKVAHMKSV
ncbi:hypothetical protein KHA80_03850 [Anaerobacillus sp. HL2]|nr:hypothetical protein KHA80_03850 [Anaerobacillus sp. HL2]